MKNTEYYDKVDKELELFNKLIEFFQDKLEFSMNRNFLIDKDELEELQESIGSLTPIVHLDETFMNTEVKGGSYLQYYAISDEEFIVEISIKLYLSLLYHAEPNFFESSQEIDVYSDTLRNNLFIEEGAFITLVSNFLQSNLSSLKIGVINNGNIDDKTFITQDGETYPIVSSYLQSVLYSVVSSKFTLYNKNSKSFTPVQKDLVQDLEKFVSTHVEFNETNNRVGYITIKKV